MENNNQTSANPPVTAPTKGGTKLVLVVHMSSPEKVFFEGEAEAVTSINDKGEFDLLPLHENFICIIKKKAIIHYKIGSEKKEFELDSGVIKIQKNRVYILTGFEVMDDKITDGEAVNAGSTQPVQGVSQPPAVTQPAA